MSEQEQAISEWPDSKKIHESLDALVAQPMWELNRDYLKEVLKWFDTHCSKSKAMIEKAKKIIPGGVQHNLAFNYPWPLDITKAEGAYLYDVDGNKYIDFLQAGGPTLLGSNYKPVQEKVIEIIRECGPITGLFHEYEYKLAEIINQYMPAVEKFRALGSGTESSMAAIRIARTATDKRKIIKGGGSYHGWNDQVAYGMHIPGSGAAEADGIPRGCYKNTQEFVPHDIEALEKMLKKNDKKGGTAAVLLEPIGAESGTVPVLKDWNKQVAELCEQYGTLLIFDEVVTGFRLGMGGAQGYFGIEPDLTIFGKIVTGGYPMAGGVGGKEEYMEYVAAGVEAGKKRAYVGGTLSANPMSCCAGYWAIKEIARTKAYLKAGRAGDRITKGLQEIIEKYQLPYVAFNHASICHLETSGLMNIDIMDPIQSKQITARKDMLHEMGAAYTTKGIITLAGSRIYTSMADNDEVIDKALAGFDEVMSHVEPPKKK
ncbi:MAG: aminotransferase class III-fold pyridoxal phosphate-dependent enzyme [Candidatus Lokiarchaeota archaeon]|nr:aminotransferase class III-fold pyridoxal phosphate-dependent enzyme [Candidatus Lokiarchaeota archaeon]